MLSSATRIGPYEILALLGQGGMGEVYRARDTVLGREVAVKLPAGLCADPEHRVRFQYEGQALAADGRRFLIPVPVNQASALPMTVVMNRMAKQ